MSGSVSSSSDIMSSMVIAMNKRSSDAQGEQVMSLLSGAIESASAIQQAGAAATLNPVTGVNAPVSGGSLGTNINLHV